MPAQHAKRYEKRFFFRKSRNYPSGDKQISFFPKKKEKEKIFVKKIWGQNFSLN